MSEKTLSDGWIDANKTQPPLLPGQDYSANVWGDAEFDNDYDIKYWQPIQIPMLPDAKLRRAADEL